MSVQDYKKQFDRYLTLYGKARESKKAIEWLRTRVDRFATSASLTKDQKDLGGFAKNLIPGKFYLFGYDPKWKDVLPIYDTVPYVLITSIDGTNSFRGINFHYLPRQVRTMIFVELYKIAANTKIRGTRNDGKVWKQSLRIASAIGQDEYLSQSIKMYLFNHVQTRFINVPKEDWALTSFLPLARMYTNKKKR